jgi:hypothetical protein
MKTSLTYLKNHLVCFGAAVLLLVSVSAAKAQILLIDDSNPNDVIITATTGTATGTQSIGISDGIELLQFFQQSTGTGFNVEANTGSTLTSVGLSTPDVLTAGFGDDFTSTGGYVDLNLFKDAGSNATMDFTQGSQALTGTLTLNLGALGLTAADLPTNGSTGTVQTGFYDDGNNSGVPIKAIGTWEVVNPTVSAPEPSSWGLLASGLVALAIFGLRSRRLRAAVRS